MLQILHNPRCGKSRACLAFVNEQKVPFEIVNYLENPLSADELESLVKKLGISPMDLVRQKETMWIDNFKHKKMTDATILKALAKYPILMERPIVIQENKAIIGREAEKLADFLRQN